MNNIKHRFSYWLFQNNLKKRVLHSFICLLLLFLLYAETIINHVEKRADLVSNGTPMSGIFYDMYKNMLKTNETAKATTEVSDVELVGSVEEDSSESTEVDVVQEEIKEYNYYYIIDDGYEYYLDKKYQDYLYNTLKERNSTQFYQLLIALMYTESKFNKDLVSYTDDYGLMQINICNHEYIKKTLGDYPILDPYQNIDAGVFIFLKCYSKYNDVSKALICYNQGHTNGLSSTSYSEKVLYNLNNNLYLLEE